MNEQVKSRRRRSTSSYINKKDENINEMFTCFTFITNSLNSLGKTFTNAEKVQKILRCVPRSK